MQILGDVAALEQTCITSDGFLGGSLHEVMLQNLNVKFDRDKGHWNTQQRI